MSSARLRTAALTAAVVCLLAACGGGGGSDSPSDPATPTAVSGDSAGASPGTSPDAPAPAVGGSPTPAAGNDAPPLGPPSQPMSAQSQSAEGVTVFLNHYIALVNWSYQTGNASRLGTYEGPDCGQCQATVKAIAGLAGKKQRMGANFFTLDAIAPPDNLAANPTAVPATLVQNATAIIDASGATVGEAKASSKKVNYNLTWTGLGWQVTDIR